MKTLFIPLEKGNVIPRRRSETPIHTCKQKHLLFLYQFLIVLETLSLACQFVLHSNPMSEVRVRVAVKKDMEHITTICGG